MAIKIDAEDARQFGFNPENLVTSAFVGVAVLSDELGIMGVLGDISSFYLLVYWDELDFSNISRSPSTHRTCHQVLSYNVSIGRNLGGLDETAHP